MQIVFSNRIIILCFRNTLHCAKELRKYGISEYYRGLTLILLRNGPSNILFFGFRTKLKDKGLELAPQSSDMWYSNLAADFISGATLGAFISTVMYPINVVKAHQQSQVISVLLK